MIKYETREQWLTAATDMMRPKILTDSGFMVPTVRVSVGFPVGVSVTAIIGQCWIPEASEDGICQVYINPILGDALRVLDVLLHELIHAIVPQDGHGKEFGKIARSVGLEGKLTATNAGPDLGAWLLTLLDELGDYPHSAILLETYETPGGKEKKRVPGKKTQTTRMLKVECTGCEFTYRTSRKWLEQLIDKYDMGGTGYTGPCALCGEETQAL